MEDKMDKVIKSIKTKTSLIPLIPDLIICNIFFLFLNSCVGNNRFLPDVEI